MEKGEIVILAIQFGALLVVVLVVGNLIPGFSAQSAPTVGTVYWGDPGSNIAVPGTGTLKTSTNQSSIYVYFHLGGTTVVSTTASRFCTAPTGNTGESTTYVRIPFGYDGVKKASYILLTPTGQRSGWTCTYNVQITDSLLQTVKWAGTVVLS